jgi:hypothetical protein
MFPRMFRLLLLLVFLFLRAQVWAGPGNDSIAELVARAGYENVRVTRHGDTLFIGLENRVWRYEPRAAAEVLKLVMPGMPRGGVVALTLMRTGIPVTTLAVTRNSYDRLLAGQITPEVFSDSAAALLSNTGYRARLRGLAPANRSFFKFDLVVAPQLKLQFGNYVHPLEVQFNVVPGLQVALLPGMTFTGQVIFPVFNNLIGDPEGYSVRPGLITLSQAFRLPYQLFATVTAGYFTRNRYGVNGEIRKFMFNGKLSAGATLGYTGQMKLEEGYFLYTPVNLFTWFADASWRFARYDLTLRAGYGGFIGGDKGWRADVTRQFGEVTVGFFAMETGGLVNGGFNFIIPLPPRKYGTRNHIRVRPASYVPWEYRAKGLPSTGRTFSTGSGTAELLFNLNPDQLRKETGKLLLNK